ncbi:hypothetical protein ACIA58_03225 [Kribbella sp. NPDC051586]|uniref:hypothetical protein n=1 Tax=Kribbella sp. NPDC051586 TaxID=3364118 RepID=UPI0037B6ABFD
MTCNFAQLRRIELSNNILEEAVTMNRSVLAACAALGMAAAAVVPGQAVASGRSASAACVVKVGSVTAGGDVLRKLVWATSPLTVTNQDGSSGDLNVFPDGQVRLSGSMVVSPDAPEGYGGSVTGWQIMGSSMYNTGYDLFGSGAVDPTTVHHALVGGGWGDFTAFDTTRAYSTAGGGSETRHQYALRSDGVLFRWEAGRAGEWSNKQSAPGFSSVKSMALISQTTTYETFLANTRGGALYTIRVPLSPPLKPIVKKVRASTWQAFDSLVTGQCGQYGVVLLGIDKDTRSAYLYAVGHANGTATVIQGLGKVPATFADPVYFRSSLIPGSEPQPFGE